MLTNKPPAGTKLSRCEQLQEGLHASRTACAPSTVTGTVQYFLGTVTCTTHDFCNEIHRRVACCKQHSAQSKITHFSILKWRSL